jgi:protein translocase SecG subunit
MQLLRNIFVGITIATGFGMVLGYLFQSPRASGLGAISGTASRFKVRAPRDLFLERLTAVCAIIFVVFVILLTVANPDIWK